MTSGPTIARRRIAGPRDHLAFSVLGACLLELLLASQGQVLGWFTRGLDASFPQGAIDQGVSLVTLLSSLEPLRIVLFAGIFAALAVALRRIGSRRLRLTRVVFGIDALLLVVSAAIALALDLGLPPLAMPVSVLGLWILASFGVGAGLLCTLALLGLLGLITGAELPLGLLLLRGIVPILMMRQSHRAQAGFWAAFVSGILVALVTFSRGAFGDMPDLARAAAAQVLVGGLLDGVLFVIGRTSAEAALGHVSRERLHDLLDLKQPLLSRMMERAPGSFEHSRAMANLAEQAASAIGADALLTRVGAYYHDLGKSCEPDFFIENLEAGQVSPHAELTPEQSAARIRHHVSEGVRILRQGGIPEPVVEFAYTHHGTQRVEYFLNKQRELEAGGGESVSEEEFRYPGMKPMTRETAILMLVDSIEAASRTLEQPGPKEIEEMLRRIVFSKLEAGQLDDSGLSMKELRLLCERVAWTLLAMNHHRIKYPWQEERPPGSEAKERKPLPALPEEVSSRRPLLELLAGPGSSDKLSS